MIISKLCQNKSKQQKIKNNRHFDQSEAAWRNPIVSKPTLPIQGFLHAIPLTLHSGREDGSCIKQAVWNQ
jgi:hypothetical protein